MIISNTVVIGELVNKDTHKGEVLNMGDTLFTRTLLPPLLLRLNLICGN